MSDVADSQPLSGETADQELARAQEQIRSLESALKSSRRIGAAVGILMATHRISYDAGYNLLVDTSQRAQRKLRDLADDVVLTGTLGT